MRADKTAQRMMSTHNVTTGGTLDLKLSVGVAHIVATENVPTPMQGEVSGL
jgi:hypothetical protein